MYAIGKLTPLIKSILESNQAARDSDSELIVQIVRRLIPTLSEAQLERLRSVNFESIRRTRQKIQQMGFYLPSREVARQRRLKSMIVQQNAVIAKPERIEHLTKFQPQALPWLEDSK